jgi:preprotein translocase subunit SecG
VFFVSLWFAHLQLVEDMSALLALLLSFLAIFLILLVLVQRGRGGGLAGALGGMGGSSAFGAKAGDIFTRITIVTASIWIAFCVISLFWSRHHSDVLGKAAAPVTPSTNLPLAPPANSTTAAGTGTAVPATGATPPATTTAPPASTAAPPASSPPAASTSAPAAPSSPAPPAEKK